MNDTDRAQWIDNDEGLYNWWRASRQSKRQFIRANRAEIDRAINRVLDPDGIRAEREAERALFREGRL